MQSSGSLVPSLLPRLSVGGEEEKLNSCTNNGYQALFFCHLAKARVQGYLVPYRADVAWSLAEQWHLVLRLYLMFRMRA